MQKCPDGFFVLLPKVPHDPRALQTFGYFIGYKVVGGIVGICFGSVDYPSFEGVVFDVEYEGIEIGFICNIPGFEPSLPEVSCSFVFFVEVDGIVHIELTHILGEGFSFDFYEQMIVIGHQAVVVDSDTTTFGIKAHQLFEVFIII